ncbi:ABC-2 type transport system permease protein [Sinosporangium album]|uniref:Transport permease protein n=1 Tax=Sinosporangium album TaxID=504805 RepID=A0A1G8ER92_9ACTN|nr:ABC transporter permease [Sinosporangium album]SDH72249.1 ABC-2 type transport system permease protein [Sinosporangium album]
MNKTLTTEIKLLVREPLAVFFPLVLPLMLLLILGLIPGLGKPDPGLGGQSYLSAYMPTTMTLLAIITTAVTILPASIVTYREQGVLRRMSTTPASPSRLLFAILLINVAVCVLAAFLLIVVGRLVHNIQVPGHLPYFVLVLLLGTSAMLSLGMLLAAVINSSRVIQAVGGVAMFPLLFLSGMWMPRHTMPDVLHVLSDIAIIGAFSDALRATWLGETPELAHLGIMAAGLAVFGFLATKLFRWT